jgi:hypothetical protein
MRTSTDALRSLKKYVAESLGDAWEVRLVGEEGAFRRPFCRVGTTTPGADAAIGARLIEKKQTFNLMAYPVERNKPEDARLEAEAVRDLMSLAFSQGTHAASMAPGRYRAHPRRVPLYDYDGIALDEPADEDTHNDRDHMRVTGDPNFTPVADPEDDLLWVITGTVTLWWTKSVVPAYSPPLVEEVLIEPIGP